ncbi:cell envelope integrity protein CreD [Magnetococcales bacterium HHB-1]
MLPRVRSTTVKIWVIAGLILLLLIPTFMVMDLVSERAMREDDAFREVASKWGGAQQFSGPTITLPHRVTRVNDKGKTYRTKHYAHFLPDYLKIAATLKPEIRHRGLFRLVLYRAEIDVKARFKAPNLEELRINENQVLWNDGYISFGVSDLVGVSKLETLTWNGTTLEPHPGRNSSALGTGFSARKAFNANGPGGEVTLKLHLNGGDRFEVLPFGKNTEVSMKADWPAPSFMGRFLPVNYKISTKDFSANWSAFHLNRSFPQQWVDNRSDLSEAAFGVRLYQPADHYQQTERALKYALLFLGLTFIAFMLVEVLRKKRCHPIQYLFVGFALLMFYVLLLALSEHMAFIVAYLISAVAIVIMITLYAYTMFRDKKLAVWMGVLLTTLYSFLYVLLRAETYSLLIGSLGLFAALGLMMYYTKDVDWYADEKIPQEKKPAS